MAGEKAPYFPFYAFDWDSDFDQRRLRCSGAGIYIRLLVAQWIEGALPDDEEALRLYTGATMEEWEQAWHILGAKFPPDQGFRRNPRLEEERRKMHELREEQRRKLEQFSELQSERGKKGGRPKKPDESRAKPGGNPDESGRKAGEKPFKPEPEPDHDPEFDLDLEHKASKTISDSDSGTRKSASPAWHVPEPENGDPVWFNPDGTFSWQDGFDVEMEQRFPAFAWKCKNRGQWPFAEVLHDISNWHSVQPLQSRKKLTAYKWLIRLFNQRNRQALASDHWKQKREKKR